MFYEVPNTRNYLKVKGNEKVKYSTLCIICSQLC